MADRKKKWTSPNGLVPVRFQKNYKGYTAGEVAGFEPHVSQSLVDGRAAEYHIPEDARVEPEPEPESEQKAAVDKAPRDRAVRSSRGRKVKEDSK